jgi:hypothetical protein
VDRTEIDVYIAPEAIHDSLGETYPEAGTPRGNPSGNRGSDAGAAGADAAGLKRRLAVYRSVDFPGAE